jgi:RHS repeat-associated protein
MGGRLLATTSGASGTETQFHHPDRLGTRLVTDAAGTVVTEQFTLPFGNSQPFTSVYGGENPYQSPTLSNPSKKRFTSYDRSDATKLDYAVNRFYSPQQGRFTQVDPIEMDATSLGNPQSLNLYSYCGNNPIDHVDPDGLFFGKIFGAIRKFFSSTIGKIVAVVALTVLSLGLLGPLTFQPILGTMSLGETVATVVGATQLTALGWATVGLAVLSGVSLPGGFGGYGGFRTPNTFPNSTGVGAISAFAKKKIPPPPRVEINKAIKIAKIIAKENGIILTKGNLAKLRKIFILSYNDAYLDLDERRYPQQGATKSYTQSGANTNTDTVTLGEHPTVSGADSRMKGGSITDSISISDADMARASEIHAVTGSFVDEYTRRLENIGFRRDYAASRAKFISKSNQARLVRYGERQRPEHLSIGLLIDAQVADAPRTVPPRVPMLPGSI